MKSQLVVLAAAFAHTQQLVSFLGVRLYQGAKMRCQSVEFLLSGVRGVGTLVPVVLRGGQLEFGERAWSVGPWPACRVWRWRACLFVRAVELSETGVCVVIVSQCFGEWVASRYLTGRRPGCEPLHPPPRHHGRNEDKSSATETSAGRRHATARTPDEPTSRRSPTTIYATTRSHTASRLHSLDLAASIRQHFLNR